MDKQTILLIDDDATLCELVSDHLQAAGYLSLTAGDGRTGLILAAKTQPDLVVLDVMMPGLDGWQVCETLRAARQPERAPVIMLTAKGEEVDKLRGFRLGVDDYVTKPFSFAELTARVGAVLARARRPAGRAARVTSGDLTIDFERRCVTLAGREVMLTPTEYRLLETLARHANHPLSTEQLLREVWGPEYAGENDYVKQHIWALRKKIETSSGDRQHLITVRGFGYRFE